MLEGWGLARSDYKHNLKGAATGCADTLNTRGERKRKVKDDSKVYGLNNLMKEVTLYQYRKYRGRSRLGEGEPLYQF